MKNNKLYFEMENKFDKYGDVSTPCPYGNNAKVGSDSCSKCFYFKKRSLGKRFVICKYKEKNEETSKTV